MPLNIDMLPLDRQAERWGEALSELGLVGEPRVEGQLSAEILQRNSPSGAQITRFRSARQSIMYPGARKGRDGLYLILHRRGRGRYQKGAAFDEGAVSVASGAMPWQMDFAGVFEILVLRMRRARVVEPLQRRMAGSSMVLSSGPFLAGIQGLLHSLLHGLEQLDDSELVPIEGALVELLTAVVHKARNFRESDLTQVQAAHFQRVTMLIGAMLTEPGLTLPRVAEMAGLSTRYLQRLFRLRETTFTDFVRESRLEMARQLLLQETGRATTIAEIAFRCGFGSAGNFTRLFRETFGMSPRDCRANARKIETRAILNRGRPTGAPDLRPWDRCATLSREALLSCRGLSPASYRHHVAVDADTVHWGFFSHELDPVLRVRSGAEVSIETLTQHASDDWERMVKGDPGAESVFHWTSERKNVERRGAGPMDASVLGRGAGEGFGVHIMTGPIHIDGAEPGDILEVNMLDIAPRPSGNPEFRGQSFASNASTWWGYHYADFIDAEDRREVVTIFEVEPEGTHARALYSFRWTPQTDPYGIHHPRIDYPGVPVDHTTIEKCRDPMPGLRIPLRPHFGVVAVMPKESALVDSIPPGNFGGNIDNWRAGKGSTIYLPVEVPGALFSVGDGHLALGDGEVNGTGLECSLTGTFRFVLHRRGEKDGHEAKRFLSGLSGPLIETEDQLVLHGFSYPNYLRDLGQDAQAEVYKRSCLDRALRSAFQSARKFLMDGWGLDEDAAITVLSVAADFGITQVADGNWGVHVVIPKHMLPTE